MAAAIAKQLLGANSCIESAGIEVDEGASATKHAIRTMKESNIDIRSHRARSLDGLNLQAFDLLIALTPAIAQTLRDRGADSSKIRELDIPDPYLQGIDAYRVTAIAIDRELRRLFATLPRKGGQE